LKEYYQNQKAKALQLVSMASKLVVPYISAKNQLEGHDYVIGKLHKANIPEVESEMSIAKGVYLIKNKQIEKAIDHLKSFEKKDKTMMSIASNNISYLYFLEKDFASAETFSDVAVKHDRYNSKALVNKGNCLFVDNLYEKAKEYYLEAIGAEAMCVEAIYNLGLAYKIQGYYNEAMKAFEKLHTIIPNSYEVIY